MLLSSLVDMFYVGSLCRQQTVHKKAQLQFLGNNKITWRDLYAKNFEDGCPAIEADSLHIS